MNKRRSHYLILLLSCALAALAIAGRAQQRSATTGDGYVAGTMSFDGSERRYLVRKPAGGAAPKAIVLLLHGGSGSAEQIIGRKSAQAPYRMWNAIADREGLLLVAPQGANSTKGLKKPGWNDCRGFEDSGQNANDVGFLTALATKLRHDYRVSGPHNFAVGTSNGGMMALRLGIERPQTFTAVASIASSMPARSECAAPTRALPVLMINGTGDPLMPYAGGEIASQFGGRGTATPAEDSIRVWARLAGGDASPATTRLPDIDRDDGGAATREVFAVRDGRPYVELIRVEGGGHTEPSRKQRYARFMVALLGCQNGDFESADEIWAFFAAQR